MRSIGVDIGGTFTDIVLFDEETGSVQVAKVPSTPQNQALGFAQGVEAVGTQLAQVQRVVHGTTVATNAAIERRGAKTALVTTAGYGDLLEIGRGQRLTGGLFDPKFVRTPPLVPRPLRFEVQERMDASGEVHVPLDEEGVRRVGRSLAELGVDAVAVCCLHSYANDAHERRIRELLAESLPQAFLCLSSQVLPEYREYERFSTTAFNAYLGPLMRRYLNGMQEWLRGRGYREDLQIMTSNAGMVSAEVAAEFPVLTILSGPAAGVSGAVSVAETAGLRDVITYDMGGTSTDVCLLKDLRPTASPARVVGGLPLKTSQLDINSIGAGGGSIGWLDTDGSFRVGPRSAGAEPGPACYGRGGQEATVADANLVLRRLGPSTLLGHRMRLYPDLALAAMERLAAKLGVPDAYHAADGVIKVAVANMVSAIRTISIEIGEDPRDFALIPFGGAGPLHACLVAEETGMSKVVVPPHPGNLSALGLLTSDLKHELVRTHLTTLDEADAGAFLALLDGMEREGRAMLSREGVPQDRMDFLYSADMRYVGQGHELNVWLAREEFDVRVMAQKFHQAHRDRFTYSREELPIQLVNLRTTAVGRVSKLRLQPAHPQPPLRPVGAGFKPALPRPDPQDALKETRDVHLRGEWQGARVYRRERLLAGMELPAPAIVEEMGSTTLIPPGWRGRVDSAGNIILVSCHLSLDGDLCVNRHPEHSRRAGESRNPEG